MKEIQLTQGKVALVDDEDFDFVNSFKWYAHHSHNEWYAIRNISLPCGGRTSEKMHRVILSRKLSRPLSNAEQVDHEYGDGLNNQRFNLRPATLAQNCRNRHCLYPGASSRFRGVSWYKKSKRWTAYTMELGHRIYLGYFASELEAALGREAYIESRPELQAKTNFPSTLWDM